jgi:uncharacterized protein (TIGR00269 family)
MKCTRCRKPSEIALRAHNSSFCRPCFIFWFRRRVLRAIEKQEMFNRNDRILIAVSGGKDSLALWHVLAEEGFQTIGFHLALGIGGYSRRSVAATREFAETHGLQLHIRSLEDEGLTVPDMICATRRPACAACGTAKRHYFDAAALELKCNVLVTGHNLDDEAARLFGNVLHWQTEHLARQSPVIQPSHPKFVRKVKPLYLSSELETATYAFMSGIAYLVEECPNATGATQLTYKALLDQLETTSPGSKASFLGEFLRRGQSGFLAAEGRPLASTCGGCGMPSWGELCSFCSLRAEVERKTAAKAGNSDDENP